MIGGGRGVGSATGKAIVRKDGTVAPYVIMWSTTKPEVTARIATDEAIKKAGLSSLSLQSKNPATITSQCSVFAESEVITLINEGIDLVDIAAGLHRQIAGRLSSMLGRIGPVEDVALTGGCAKNEGLVKALEEKLGVSIKRLTKDREIVGAVGAALIARERLSRQS